MTQALIIDQAGGPEVLRWGEVQVGQPGPGQARIRHTAIGVNFVDVYFRKGMYPPPGGFPFIDGQEGAGVVESVGEGVTGLKPGDRVVYQGVTGAYAEERLIAAEKLIHIPDDVDDKVAAAVFLKGLTVQALLRRTFRVEKGQTILWHAAAGGVGSIACQWAHSLGATVIGTVGSDDKIAQAKANGCDYVISYHPRGFRRSGPRDHQGGGRPGRLRFDRQGYIPRLDRLPAPARYVVSFGQSSGLPPPFPISLLQQKGSLFATRPTVSTYVAKRADLEAAAKELFAVLESGAVKVGKSRELPLREAAEAHRALEARKPSDRPSSFPDGAFGSSPDQS